MNDKSELPAPARHWVTWRSAILIGACAAGGLTLNLMVLGSTPGAPTAQAVEAVAVVVTAAPQPALPEAAPPVSEATVVDAAVAPPIAEAVTTMPPAGSLVQPVAVPAAALAAPVEALLAAPVAAPAARLPTPSPQAPAAPQAATPSATAEPTAIAPKNPPATIAATTTSTNPSTTTAQTQAPTTTATTTTTTTTTTAPQHTIGYPKFTVSGIAEIYLKQVDDREISVYSVIREPNWVYQIDKNGPTSVEVKFFNVVTEREAEFHAEIQGGTIKVEGGQ